MREIAFLLRQRFEAVSLYGSGDYDALAASLGAGWRSAVVAGYWSFIHK